MQAEPVLGHACELGRSRIRRPMTFMNRSR
jgi:hypothetical protein